MSLECTCPAARGQQGRICGVNHPDCTALQGLSTADLVVTPTFWGVDFGHDDEPPAVPTAATTVHG
jgi:hypothetical protein